VRLGLVGTCSVCHTKGPPGRACCGLPVEHTHEPPPPAKPRFGQGPRPQLPRENKERMKERKARQFSAQTNLARASRCVACQAPPPSEAAHMRSRGAWGSDRDVLPLCSLHHDEQERLGIDTFEVTYKLNLQHLLVTLRNKVKFHGCQEYAEPHGKGWRCLVCHAETDPPASPRPAEVTP
jgi:hypothetical protein